jgi:hypothetical protein
MSAYHLSKTGKPGGKPQCGRGTTTTSGLSVPAEQFAKTDARCGHCARTVLGKSAVGRYVDKPSA